MNVQTRAKRILSHLDAYQSVEASDFDSDSASEDAGTLGATLIGTYQNPDGQERLLISDLGIFVENGSKSTFVEYKSVQRMDIVANETPVEDDVNKKIEANGILVEMSGPMRKLIPVRNGHGRYRDVFEFARFMRRVIDDTKEENLS